jgi:1-acyl-sn-glycerol-3-phosphate acyltransferase
MMTTTVQSVLPRRLRFGMRWVTSMLSFVVFGLGGLILGVVLFPLVMVTSRRPAVRIRRRRLLLQRMLQLYIHLMDWTGTASFRVIGQPAADRNYLIVANHPTLLDAVYLLAVFPQVDCIVKHDLMRNPFTRSALSGLDYVSNADTAGMLDAAVERLRRGRSVLVFPEGTRSRPGQPLHFHLAAATMAVRSGVPCQPVIVRCEPLTVTKGTPWYEIAPERPHFTIEVDQPVDIVPITRNLSARYAKRALNQFLQDYYNRRLVEFRGVSRRVG